MRLKKSNQICIIFLILFSLLRILLSMQIPLTAHADWIHDDQLLVEYTQNILSGDWLGDYNNRTLVKGVAFPIFLALCKILFIPYTVGISFLNIISAVVFVFAIRYLVKNKKLLMLFYLLLIYAPISFSQLVSQRVYRMAVIPYAVILVIGCVIGLYLRRKEPVKKILPWSLGAGVSLSFFWFLREDSIWILPMVIVILAVTIIYIIYTEKIHKRTLMKAGVVCLPVIFLGIAYFTICSLNYNYYGIFTTNDRSGTEFGKMMSNLYRIKDDTAPDGVWVSEKVIDEVMEISPIFKSIESEMKVSLNAWIGDDPKDYLSGDIIAWAIRDAVDFAGYYSSAEKANKFYEAVNEDIEKAFEAGLLEDDELLHFTSQSEGISVSELPVYLKLTLKNMLAAGTYDFTGVSCESASTGDIAAIRNIEALTGNQALYPSRRDINLEGWIFLLNDDDKLSAEIVDENGVCLEKVNFFESEDVYDSYPQYKNARKARFSTTLQDVTEDINIFVNIYINGELADTIKPVTIEKDEYKAWFSINEKYMTDPLGNLSKSAVDISNRIVNIYKFLSKLATVIAGIAYIALTIFLLMHIKEINNYEKYRDLWLIILGILLSSFVLTLGVSFFCSWLTNYEYNVASYNVGSYPLLQIAKYLAIYSGGTGIIRLVKKLKV